MIKTVGREKELAKEQIKRAQGKLLAGDMDLREKDPEAWEMMLKSHDLPLDLFDGGKTLGQIQEANTVQIRRKSDGALASVPIDQAEEILKSNKYERVN